MEDKPELFYTYARSGDVSGLSSVSEATAEKHIHWRHPRNDRRTPLWIACKHGRVSAVRWLLAHGADASICDKFGFTALHAAVEEGHRLVVEELLRHNKALADAPTVPDNFSPLYIAAMNNRVSVLACLLDQGHANVALSDANLCSPLMAAAVGNHVQCMQLLLRKDAPIDQRAANGWTALHFASAQGKAEAVRCLLENGANLGAETADGKKKLAVELAKEGGHRAAEVILLNPPVCDAVPPPWRPSVHKMYPADFRTDAYHLALLMVRLRNKKDGPLWMTHRGIVGLMVFWLAELHRSSISRALSMGKTPDPAKEEKPSRKPKPPQKNQLWFEFME